MATIVCICGSTRFREEIAEARARLTLRGEIVLGPEVLVRSDPAYSDLHDSSQKVMLDQLHIEKIDLADYVYVVNPGGYIGDSTRREIAYSEGQGKRVEYLMYWEDRMPKVGDWALHREKELDVRRVDAVSSDGTKIKIRLFTRSSDWLPARNYLYSKERLNHASV